MSKMASTRCYVVMVLSIVVISSMMASCGANLFEDLNLTWGDNRANISNDGQLLSLSLDKASGSGFQSKKEYLFTRIDMQLKLVAGNSAGIVTAYYVSPEVATHDEIDFELLGNLSGDPYILHTNVFTQGKGNREQQFYLWFDPTADFHTYSIIWNPKHIVFMVDESPIRVFKKAESAGVPFPKKQQMRIYGSLWNADNWATRGGSVKTDWSKAPFTAYFRNFKATDLSSTVLESDKIDLKKLRWVQKNYMIYNYCQDYKKFSHGFPAECKINP
ncbi:unnamed protein product [Lupinus luteus]|uniref:Xyloglucan endotransglucosylase/hydrolase n=1 Tax=Lupinus luteus TaxID=3873 RepID=A0AAV1XHL3_LUPLU